MIFVLSGSAWMDGRKCDRAHIASGLIRLGHQVLESLPHVFAAGSSVGSSYVVVSSRWGTKAFNDAKALGVPIWEYRELFERVSELRSMVIYQEEACKSCEPQYSGFASVLAAYIASLSEVNPTNGDMGDG